MTGLMGAAGVLLLVCAVPEGIAFGLQVHYQTLHLETGVAVLAGFTMTLATAVIGAILLGLCITLSKRRRRAKSGGTATR